MSYFWDVVIPAGDEENPVFSTGIFSRGNAAAALATGKRLASSFLANNKTYSVDDLVVVCIGRAYPPKKQLLDAAAKHRKVGN